MARFTQTDLANACASVNAVLKRKGSQYTIQSQGRNGYAAIDLYEGKKCVRNIETGTPRECDAALHAAAFDLLSILP